MSLYSLIVSIFLFLASCNHSRELVDQPGSFKTEVTVIALAPFINSSTQDLPWNVSDELNQLIRDKLASEKKSILLQDEATFNFFLQINPMTFDNLCHAVPESSGNINFVVVVDLLQHDLLPIERHSLPECEQTRREHCSSLLMMKAKLAIIDVRESCSKVILEETISSSQLITKDYEFWNYSKNCKGSYNYPKTPYSQAHNYLANVLVDKIQNAVETALSR
jgi:hypothetical protein